MSKQTNILFGALLLLSSMVAVGESGPAELAQSATPPPKATKRSANKKTTVDSESNSKKATTKDVTTFYITAAKNIQTPKSFFFQSNVGPGFLYFSDIKGSTLVKYATQVESARSFSFFGSNAINGPMHYNRTPAVEFLFGYRYNQWLKTAFSYLHQGNTSIQTPMIRGLGVNSAVASTTGSFSQLRADLSLDALMLKVCFDIPFPLVWNKVGFFPFVAVALGGGWQSWTNVELEQTGMNLGIIYSSQPLPLRNHIFANAVWMVDAGFRLQKADPNHLLSVLFGCKFMDWGQVRNIGKYSQQANVKRGLSDPFRAKMLYSFIPYIGVQWDFPAGVATTAPALVQGHNPNTWKPFTANASAIQRPNSFWTQFNVGAGFLYFSDIQGNDQVTYLTPSTTSANATLFGANTFNGPIRYNRTPVVEALLGYRFNQWLKTAFSYLHQGSISVQTPMQQRIGTVSAALPNTTYSQLRTNLSLDGVLFKVYFESFLPIIFKGLGLFPYISGGVGCGWQSWTNVQLEQNFDVTSYSNDPLLLRNKILANVVWMVDSGFRVQRANPEQMFSVLLGCKFMDWGQARNIGKYSQQANYKIGLTHPFSVKMLYSFIPYMGAQWDFPVGDGSSKPFLIKGRNPNTWKPFIAKANEIQNPSGFWTQANVGPGFLYFSNISGSTDVQYESWGQTIATAAFLQTNDFKGPIRYNRSPAIEALLGYRFNQWFKVGLSYLHQGNISIQTPMILGKLNELLTAAGLGEASTDRNSNFSQLRANLNLDALLLKVYFELPLPLIWKGLGFFPYLSGAVGGGWQSWTNIELEQTATLASVFLSEPLPLKNRIEANTVWMVDPGIRIQRANPNHMLSVLMGCKFVDWGQSLNIGRYQNQSNVKRGFVDPLYIKMIYSFIPYIGVEWEF